MGKMVAQGLILILLVSGCITRPKPRNTDYPCPVPGMNDPSEDAETGHRNCSRFLGVPACAVRVEKMEPGRYKVVCRRK